MTVFWTVLWAVPLTLFCLVLGLVLLGFAVNGLLKILEWMYR